MRRCSAKLSAETMVRPWVDEYINAQKTATGFDLRFTDTMMPIEKDWREFIEVLSQR